MTEKRASSPARPRDGASGIGSDRTPPSEPVKRTSEIEEISNLYVIHPLSSRLTPIFANLHITPNAVSLTGMACGVMAGFAYDHYETPAWTCAGFLLMIAWHVFDGVDGQLARLTNAQSAFGKVLDGICDYSTFLAVYVGLGLALARQHGAWVWGLIALSAICHAVQAAAYEVQRQDYAFWGMGKMSADLLGPRNPAPDPATEPMLRRLAQAFNRLYERLQLLAAGIDISSRRHLTEAMNRRPERDGAHRQAYRELFAPRVRLWSLMSANLRSFGIFVFALLGVPLCYFYVEISVLSAIFAALLFGQRSLHTDFRTRLDAIE